MDTTAKEPSVHAIVAHLVSEDTTPILKTTFIQEASENLGNRPKTQQLSSS